MNEEHKKFLDQHVSKNGFFCIVDALEEHFNLSKADACQIFDEYEEATKGSATTKAAEMQLQGVADKASQMLENVLRDHFEGGNG